jgi:hypothetical protein
MYLPLAGYTFHAIVASNTRLIELFILGAVPSPASSADREIGASVLLTEDRLPALPYTILFLALALASGLQPSSLALRVEPVVSRRA